MPTTSAIISYSPDIYSIYVELTGLDSGFAYEGRVAQWSIVGTGYSRNANVTLPPKISSGGGTTFSGLTPSTTYRIFCGIQLPNGGNLYTPSNNGVSVTTLEPEKTRPSNWSWTHVGLGQNLSFPASEWNDFTDRINEFRAYKDMNSYSFTVARAGMDITNAIINQAVTAINAMSPPTRASSAVVRVTDYNAAYFNSLARALNSIT